MIPLMRYLTPIKKVNFHYSFPAAEVPVGGYFSFYAFFPFRVKMYPISFFTNHGSGKLLPEPWLVALYLFLLIYFRASFPSHSYILQSFTWLNFKLPFSQSQCMRLTLFLKPEPAPLKVAKLYEPSFTKPTNPWPSGLNEMYKNIRLSTRKSEKLWHLALEYILCGFGQDLLL